MKINRILIICSTIYGCGTGPIQPDVVRDNDGGDTSVITCGIGQTNCNSECVNTSNDPLHCGSCDGVCFPGAPCNNGVCQIPADVVMTDAADAIPDNPTDSGVVDVVDAPTDSGVVIPGLVVYYPFNGDCNEMIGGGSLTGMYSPASDRRGNTTGAIHLNSAILTQSVTNLPVFNSSRTVSFWVHSTYPGIASGPCILNWGTYGPPGERFGVVDYDYPPSNGDVFFVGGNADFATTSYLRDTHWHHVVVTYDGTAVSIWFDGSMVARTNETLNTVGLELVIGGVVPPYGNMIFWSGDLDELRIYNRVLTMSEISILATY